MWGVTFEVAFDVDPGTEPAPADWTDLSDRFRATDAYVTVDYGRSHEVERFEAGTASVKLDDRDRDLDPTSGSTVYNLVPVRHARLMVNGAPLFRGFVEAWPPVWTRADATVEVQLVDGFKWLGLQDADLDLPQQYAHERITAVLDIAGWPAELRDIEQGVVLLEESVQESANLLSVLHDTADSEEGELYCSPDGKLTFRSRHSRFELPTTTLARVADLQALWDEDDLINVGRVELASGDVYEITDAASAASYGRRMLAVRDLALPWHEANGMADWMVHRYQQPNLRATARLNGLHEGMLDVALGLRPGTLVEASRTVPHPFTFEGMVERVTHDVAKAEWSTTLELSPYFGAGPWMVWHDDTATAGSGWLSDTATQGAKWAP